MQSVKRLAIAGYAYWTTFELVPVLGTVKVGTLEVTVPRTFVHKFLVIALALGAMVLWASEPDHLGISTAVEKMLKARWKAALDN